mmetsp:Transcript_74179/g.188205  ORF Transcript_74179/g.188205 Transcript_74179/m.188205 type:complete len:222 (+) Transcript_74179:143-808(+)
MTCKRNRQLLAPQGRWKQKLAQRRVCAWRQARCQFAANLRLPLMPIVGPAHANGPPLGDESAVEVSKSLFGLGPVAEDQKYVAQPRRTVRDGRIVLACCSAIRRTVAFFDDLRHEGQRHRWRLVAVQGFSDSLGCRQLLGNVAKPQHRRGRRCRHILFHLCCAFACQAPPRQPRQLRQAIVKTGRRLRGARERNIDHVATSRPEVALGRPFRLGGSEASVH